jgi:MFS family permease
VTNTSIIEPDPALAGLATSDRAGTEGRQKGWDKAYETKAVWLLTLGFGLVGLDRFVLMPLFPVVSRDLGLTYQDLGLVSGILSLTWGLSSVISGPLSDRYGRRIVIIPAVLAFSALAGLTGLVVGLASLLAIRALMGVFEGAAIPSSIAAITEASHPARIGRNVGLQQMAQPLVGLAIAPILATQLLDVVPSWRWIFLIVSLPGFVLAYCLFRILRDTNVRAPHASRAAAGEQQLGGSWLVIFSYRDVALNIFLMLCWLSTLVVIAALMPNYLTDHLGLSLKEMGFVMAANGLGSAAGALVLPAMSDRVRRKQVVLVAVSLQIVLLFVLMHMGASPIALGTLLFLITGLSTGVAALTVGPLTTQAVPAALTSTAIGCVVGFGEILGGFGAPTIAGIIAQSYGIAHILWICLATAIAGLCLSFGLREPRS